jgi:hypothetical protein
MRVFPDRFNVLAEKIAGLKQRFDGKSIAIS